MIIFILFEQKRRALKVVPQTEIDSETLTEIELLKNLNSPYIIKYYHHFLEEQRLFHLIMEYCPVTCLYLLHLNNFKVFIIEFWQGGDLKTVIEETKIERGSIPRVLEWSMDCLLGLKYLHDENIIHRDIKPE